MEAPGGRLCVVALLMMVTMTAMVESVPRESYRPYQHQPPKPIRPPKYPLPVNPPHHPPHHHHPPPHPPVYRRPPQAHPPPHPNPPPHAHPPPHRHPPPHPPGYRSPPHPYPPPPPHLPPHPPVYYPPPHPHLPPRGYPPHHRPEYHTCEIPSGPHGEKYNFYGIEYKGSHEYDGLYYVAFLGKACIGKPIHDLLSYSGHNDTSRGYQPCGCPTLTRRYSTYGCSNNHYKSAIMVDWEKMCIDKVRVSLYKRRHEVLYFIFDGQGTTADNFFSKEKLLYSPYSDLNDYADTNYFSIKGHVQRRFFINKVYGGNCKKDKGWHAVIDAPDYRDKCEWTNLYCYPKFLYSTEGTSTVWEDGAVGEADILVIYVKLKKYSPMPKYTDIRTCH